MVDADHLRIVFRVNGVSFVMPVADLLAIRGEAEDDLTSQVQDSASVPLGFLNYRGTDARLYDLASLFELAEESNFKEGPLLVFAGSDSPWAVRVDSVDGVFDTARFEFQDLPAYLFRDELVPYHQIALYEGQLLVSLDAQQIDLAWRRAG